ncbi:hypothetical protein [Streptomyces sp. NPDC003863]
MSAVRKTVTSVLTATVLSGGLALGTAGPASAAGCGTSASPVIDGASASWSIRCSGGRMTIAGWVQDTRADAKCALIRIHAGDNPPARPEACGSGVRKNFSYTFKAKNVDARLAIA